MKGRPHAHSLKTPICYGVHLRPPNPIPQTLRHPQRTSRHNVHQPHATFNRKRSHPDTHGTTYLARPDRLTDMDHRWHRTLETA